MNHCHHLSSAASTLKDNQPTRRKFPHPLHFNSFPSLSPLAASGLIRLHPHPYPSKVRSCRAEGRGIIPSSAITTKDLQASSWSWLNLILILYLTFPKILSPTRIIPSLHQRLEKHPVIGEQILGESKVAGMTIGDDDAKVERRKCSLWSYLPLSGNLFATGNLFNLFTAALGG